MSFITVPDTLSFAIHQVVRGVPLVNIYYLHDSAGTSGIDQAYADGVRDGIEAIYDASGLEALLSTEWSATKLVVTDLSSEGGPQFTSAFTDLVGEGGGDSLPGQAAACISWLTGTRGRSFRGRTFHGGLTEAMVAATLTPTAHTAFQNFADTMISSFDSGTANLVVVSRFEGFVFKEKSNGERVKVPKPRDGDTAVVTEILTATVSTLVRTQRRREFVT